MILRGAKENVRTQERIAMSDGSVEIKDLVKTYVDDRGRPTFTAVKKISLHIENGEFMVLVGPSGCGKSTTLRMVAGLEKITSGTISIGGRVVNELEPKDRGIAMVFQNYALYPHMSVASNMAFGLKMRKFPKDQIQERIKRAAAIIKRAADNGRTEVEVGRFPNRLFTDLGRAINQQEAGWEKTLTGLPKELYEFWQLNLKPRGYRLRFQIVDFPGGMPGDIGMTLSWV